MKILTFIVGAYFLILSALNVYFVWVLQAGGVFVDGFVKFVLTLERPVVWILNKVPLFYVGNMHVVSDVTMRSSIIMLCASLALLIACVLFIRIED